MKSGFAGQRCPELAWIIKEKRKTIIFSRTINLGFQAWNFEKDQLASPEMAASTRAIFSLMERAVRRFFR